MIVLEIIRETIQGSFHIPKTLLTKVVPPLGLLLAHITRANILTRTAMVEIRSRGIARTIEIIRRRPLRHQLESRDTLTFPQIATALPLTPITKNLQTMVTTGLPLAKLLISSATDRPLPDRGLIYMSRERDHTGTPRKRAMEVLNAKKKRMLNNASAGIRRSPMRIGKSSDARSSTCLLSSTTDIP